MKNLEQQLQQTQKEKTDAAKEAGQVERQAHKQVHIHTCTKWLPGVQLNKPSSVGPVNREKYRDRPQLKQGTL